jgi:hypothetical protein
MLGDEGYTSEGIVEEWPLEAMLLQRYLVSLLILARVLIIVPLNAMRLRVQNVDEGWPCQVPRVKDVRGLSR